MAGTTREHVHDRRPPRGRRTLLVAACFVAAGALARDDAATSALRRIETLIGDAACSADIECRTLPLGRRACGGPDRILVWSTRRTDAAALEQAAAAYDAAPRALPGATVSICAMLVDTGASCVRAAGHAAGRCQPKPGDGTSPAAGPR